MRRRDQNNWKRVSNGYLQLENRRLIRVLMDMISAYLKAAWRSVIYQNQESTDCVRCIRHSCRTESVRPERRTSLCGESASGWVRCRVEGRSTSIEFIRSLCSLSVEHCCVLAVSHCDVRLFASFAFEPALCLLFRYATWWKWMQIEIRSSYLICS